MKSYEKDIEIIGCKCTAEAVFFSSTTAVLMGFVALFYVFFFQNFFNSGKLDFVIAIIIFAVFLTGSCILMIILSVLALICPKELIAVTETEIILLAKKKIVPLQTINCINCSLAYINTGISKASNPGFGKIIIKTSSEKIVQRHIKNVSLVAEKLNSLCKL